MKKYVYFISFAYTFEVNPVIQFIGNGSISLNKEIDSMDDIEFVQKSFLKNQPDYSNVVVQQYQLMKVSEV